MAFNFEMFSKLELHVFLMFPSTSLNIRQLTLLTLRINMLLLTSF